MPSIISVVPWFCEMALGICWRHRGAAVGAQGDVFRVLDLLPQLLEDLG